MDRTISAADVGVVAIPDSLGAEPHHVERAIEAVRNASWLPGTRVVFDLRSVSFVRPYGALQLLRLCEAVSAATGTAVELTSVRRDVHAYLRRIDFFTSSPMSTVTLEPFDSKDDHLRSPSSTNVFELHPITTENDVNNAITAAQRILAFWLSQSVRDRGSVVNLISEACRNVVLHSGAAGWMLAQKYERQPVVVELAIGDGGKGIPGSLRDTYGPIVKWDSEFIVRAMQGLSSRRPNERSVGLPTMRITTEASGGYLFTRSGSGRVNARSGRFDKRDQLTPLAGTQIAMCFQASQR